MTQCSTHTFTYSHKELTLQVPWFLQIWWSYQQKQIMKSLAHGRHGSNFKNIICKFVIQNSSYDTLCETAFRWMPQYFTYYKKSTLVQEMAWCHQVPSHYLRHCWPIFMLPKRGHKATISLQTKSAVQCSTTLWSKGNIIIRACLPLDKMAAILSDDISKRISLNEKFRILIEISLKFVPKGPIDNNPVMV